MAKQIKEINFLFTGDATEVTDIGVGYKVDDSGDARMVKEGTVELDLDDSKTLAEVHALAKAAIETAEGL